MSDRDRPWYVWCWTAQGSTLVGTFRWRWAARRRAAWLRWRYPIPGTAYLVAERGAEAQWSGPVSYTGQAARWPL